jgi:hypothetical protein
VVHGQELLKAAIWAAKALAAQLSSFDLHYQVGQAPAWVEADAPVWARKRRPLHSGGWAGAGGG